MTGKTDKSVFRDMQDAATYWNNNHPESGAYLNTTILGDEPSQPGHCDPTDSDYFDYVHITTLPVGTYVREHSHTGNEQFYLVIRGHAEITLCGEKFEAKPYSIALIKDGGSHGIRNIGDTDLVYVCCQTPINRK
jgi:mannose-6-phosphate isomerase-like protein (cupin superfamily)